LDIKLKKDKKRHPVLSWLSFILSISILATYAGIGLMSLPDMYGNRDSLKALLSGDIHNIPDFKYNMLYSMDVGVKSINDGKITNEEIERKKDLVENEVQNRNLNFYAIDTNSQKEYKPNGKDFGIKAGQKPNVTAYSYSIYFNGKMYTVTKNGKTFYHVSSLARAYFPNMVSLEKSLEKQLGLSEMTKGMRVFIGIKQPLHQYENAPPSNLYEMTKEIKIFRIIGSIAIGLFVFTAFMLVYAIIKREDRKRGKEKLTHITGKIFLEFKAAAAIFVSILLSFCISVGFNHVDSVTDILIIWFGILLVSWFYYLIILDLFYNRVEVFKHNIINCSLKKYRDFEAKLPFEKALLKRLTYYRLTQVGLILISLCLFVICLKGAIFFSPFLLASVIGVFYLAYRYKKKYSEDLADFAKLCAFIENASDEKSQTAISLSPQSLLRPTADSLVSIYEDAHRAAEESLKNERMKIELITNVSHDLKTPLTSIVSFVDLLSKEESLPEHVKDYIKVLASKSERLKQLIQDLFDLSKASSQTIEIQKETLDLVKLIKQVQGDLQDRIDASDLEFVYTLPSRAVYTQSDGNKLHRVLQNLVVNALKYSLKGSRVYVSLEEDDVMVEIIIKNTSAERIDFTEEEICGRFVRGDKNRSTEGTGLGLAIAKSYTQVCGGFMHIELDGDLFKVILRFPQLALSEDAEVKE